MAFTAYDSEEEWILDPSYGELNIVSYEWGLFADGSTFAKRTPLGTHICTREELGLEEDRGSAKFFPMNAQTVDLVRMY